MKVGLDISQIAHQGGVATYTENLAYQLSKIDLLDMTYFYSSLRKPYKGNLSNVRNFPMPPLLFEILFNRIRKIPIEKFIGNIDIFHSSDWAQPPTKAKKVTTYHDVVPLKYPQWSIPAIIEVHRRRLKIVEKEIDMVITVSESTKKDLLEISHIPEEKITVIHEAAGKQFKLQQKQDVEEFRKKMQLPEKFVLAIGGIGERKNLKRIKEAAQNYNLVIAGETIPWISDNELPLLYSAARVLLYPSFYEGFGLPILEAMACGTPVITSNISATAEIAGDNAFLVDPYDIKNMSLNLKVLMEDEEIREDMIGNGISRASSFTWERTAADTVEVYKKILKL